MVYKWFLGFYIINPNHAYPYLAMIPNAKSMFGLPYFNFNLLCVKVGPNTC